MPNSPAWHRLREGRLGASEVPPALGISPWQSRFSLFCHKAGLVVPEDISQEPPVYWGTTLEPVIAAEYARRHPEYYVEETGTWVHPTEPWMSANPDRLVFQAEAALTPIRLLECKTARSSADWGDPGTDDIPDYYQAQVIWQMDVMGVDVVDVAVLIGGSDYREYTVTWDPEEADAIRAAAREFWDMVERGEAPPVDEMESTSNVLRRMYNRNDEGQATVPDELAAQYWAAQEAVNAAKADLELARNRLLDRLGNARQALTADGTKVAYRQVTTPRRFNTEAFRAAHPELAAEFTVTSNPVVALKPYSRKES